MDSDSMEQEFFDFVYERQKIWYKRLVLGQKPPWTSDSTLQNYKILNVYRELDKGTEYIIDKLKGLNNRESVFLNVVFYRFFNKFGLYEELGMDPFREFDKEIFKNIKSSLEKLKSSGEPIFNDAYLIASRKGEQKHISVLNILHELGKNIGSLISKLDNSESPEESFRTIQKIPLVGNFLAYEIWTDLTYFDFFIQGWTDNDFVNIGPGAETGLEIIYGESSERLLERLNKIQGEYLLKKSSPPWEKICYKYAFSNAPFLSLRNIEHSLCEFRKYYNLKNGKGKKRAFIPTSF